jgi:hypothetical protein
MAEDEGNVGNDGDGGGTIRRNSARFRGRRNVRMRAETVTKLRWEYLGMQKVGKNSNRKKRRKVGDNQN